MLKKLLTLALLLPSVALAAVIMPINGGTGSSTLSGILKGNGKAMVGTVAIGSNLTWDGTTLSASGGAGSPYPFTPTAYGNSTSSLIAFTNGIIASASSTIQDLNSASSTLGIILATKASSTNLFTNNLTIGSLTGVLKSVTGQVVGGATTLDLTENTNLYFTDPRARLAVSGLFAATTSANTWTALNTYTVGGIISLASSTLQTLNSTNATIGTLSLGNYLTVANGGTGAGTLTGLLKGNGTSAFTIGANGTDYTLISSTTCGGTDKVSAISASGAVTCTADSTGSGSGAPYPFQLANNATSTLTLFNGGLGASFQYVATSTNNTSFSQTVWGRSKSAGIIDCLIPWPSGVAATADQIGTALIADAPCRGNYTFTVNTDATLLPWTLANEQLVTASGTPFMTRFVVNNTAGWAAASPELGIFQSVMLGSATSSNGMGLAQEGWIQLPNWADATTSATYIAGGFSNITNAVTVATVAGMVDNTEQCLLVASSTNWALYTAVAGVRKVTVTSFATSSSAFKYLITLDQSGCNVYFNNNPTAAATVTSIPTSHLRAIHGIGLTGGMTTGRAEMRLGHITNWLPYY